MRPVVRAAFLEFTEPFEGGVACLYNDVRGKTTIAYGNLCDTPSEASALDLVHPGGAAATSAEKIAAWHAVHDDPRAAALGWRYAATLSALRLTPEGMARLALGRLDANDRILRARLPDWESYPACAQLALHSLAWAAGANAHYPRLFADIANRDFEAASDEIRINEYTPEGIHNFGVIPRNVANKVLMKNAQRVESYKLDPDLLEWEHDLAVADAPTLPSIAEPDSEPTICTNVLPLLNTPIMGDDE